MFQPQRKINTTWTGRLAYGIGLIASDGYLHNDGRHIGFVSKDLELISKFKTSLALTNKISKAARGGEKEKKYFCLRFGDKIFYQFLNSIGLTAAKSKTIKAVAIPVEYFPDFLRGLFDGDGTFYTYWDKRWPNSFGFKLSFASASLEFINWLKEKLNLLYAVKGYIHKGAGVYNLEYVKGDSKKLFSVMYYQTNLLFLDRKYYKIKTALKKDNKFGLSFLQKSRVLISRTSSAVRALP